MIFATHSDQTKLSNLNTDPEATFFTCTTTTNETMARTKVQTPSTQPPDVPPKDAKSKIFHVDATRVLLTCLEFRGTLASDQILPHRIQRRLNFSMDVHPHHPSVAHYRHLLICSTSSPSSPNTRPLCLRQALLILFIRILAHPLSEDLLVLTHHSAGPFRLQSIFGEVWDELHGSGT